VTAFDDANAVIGLIPQLSEVKQLGQIRLSDPDIIGALRRGSAAVAHQPAVTRNRNQSLAGASPCRHENVRRLVSGVSLLLPVTPIRYGVITSTASGGSCDIARGIHRIVLDRGRGLRHLSRVDDLPDRSRTRCPSAASVPVTDARCHAPGARTLGRPTHGHREQSVPLSRGTAERRSRDAGGFPSPGLQHSSGQSIPVTRIPLTRRRLLVCPP
jgi:hypothetical protein